MSGEQPKRPPFFEGMVFAYEDCAKIVERIRDGLPPEMLFAKPGLNSIATGIRNKIKEVDELIAEKEKEKDGEADKTSNT